MSASSHTHVGTAPPGYQNEWVTHTVHYHGFASLLVARGECVPSPEFMLLGNPWRLELFPGGYGDAEEGMVSIYLGNRSNKAIDIEFSFSINDGNGKQVAYKRSPGPKHFGGVQFFKGWRNFAKRSTLLSSLVNGALVIDVHIRLAKPTKSVPPPFIPENPSACKTVQGVFLDEKYSDIVFEIRRDHTRKNSAMKVAKTTPVTFPAHRVIVSKCSSILAELCESHNDDTTPIQINDVTPNIFRLLLSYMYGGKVSEVNMKYHEQEIIEAADKYGVVNLKLEAEASRIEGIIFTIENVKEI